MPVCPFAKWEPLNRTSPAMPAPPTCGITHSNAANSDDLLGWWDSNPDGLMSTAQCNWEGQLYQYVDTLNEAFANVAANVYAGSLEVANSPDYQAGKVAFDDDDYSPEQVKSIIAWWVWYCSVHLTVARELCTDGRNGLGAHDWFSYWTTPGHVCPGALRSKRLREDIYPAVFTALANPKGSFMADLTDAEQHELLDTVRRLDKRSWQTRVADDSRWKRLLAFLHIR